MDLPNKLELLLYAAAGAALIGFGLHLVSTIDISAVFP